MISVGQPVPDATVWLAPRESMRLRDLEEPLLLVAYYFDWSST